MVVVVVMMMAVVFMVVRMVTLIVAVIVMCIVMCIVLMLVVCMSEYLDWRLLGPICLNFDLHASDLKMDLSGTCAQYLLPKQPNRASCLD